MKAITWPAWFSSPDGKTCNIFATAEDVPSGWTSGAEKQSVGNKPAAKNEPTPTPVPPSAGQDTSEKVELDAHGHPWSADLHASSKSKTSHGLWRMKVGVTRPDPAPGYPLDL